MIMKIACVYNSPKNVVAVKKVLLFKLTEPDYIIDDIRDLSFLPGDSELDIFTVSRNNEDVSINYFG